MFVSLRMFTLPEDRVHEQETIITALRGAAPRLPGALSSWISPIHSAAAINAGHIIWRMCHASEADAQAATTSTQWRESIAPAIEGLALTAAGYRMSRSNVSPAGPGIWRALLFSCFAQSDPATVRELEEKTLLLPKYVPEIRSWGLNRTAWSEGTRRIEYVWEQEYDSIDGLTGPYMDTPVHWGIVDAHFDADCPEYVVDPHLIQMVGEIDRTIMDGG